MRIRSPYAVMIGKQAILSTIGSPGEAAVLKPHGCARPAWKRYADDAGWRGGAHGEPHADVRRVKASGGISTAVGGLEGAGFMIRSLGKETILLI
jgi:hypothetical protein